MIQLKRYKKITIPVILTTVLLVMFIVQIHAANLYPIADGGEVYTAEDFVNALGGDEFAYNDGDIIILKSDLSIENPIIIKSGHYEIQGTGCHIEFIGSGFILDSGSLTLGNDKGSDDHPSLTFDGGGNKVNAVQINNGTLNIYVGTLITGFTDSPIHMVTGTINMNGGMITNNTAEVGGAINIENGDLIIMQGTISENSAVDGGAIYSVNGYINMVSPVIHNNTATEKGGAVWNGNGDLIINNGSYQYNEAKDGGFIHNNGAVTLGGGTYAYNKAVNGGVVMNFNELYALNVNNTTMTFNEADNGAVIYNNGYFELNDAQITYNTASISGGGIANYGDLLMLGGSVSMNESNQIAGGVANHGKFEMKGGSVSSNKSELSAKGVLNADELILSDNCFISFNNDVMMAEGATIQVTSILTANTPVATLTLDESEYIKGTQIIIGDETILTSASEKIAITQTDNGTWSIGIDGRLIYERAPLTLTYQIVIAVSALIVIAVVVIISVRIRRRRKN